MATARVALVTGGARGIGRGIALDLARAGWKIGICHRTSAQDATATCQQIEALGSSALALCCDVSDPVAVEELIDAVETRFGGLDAVINAAGPYHRARLLEETPESWRAMFANNLDPVFFTARVAAPRMAARRWGRILNFSMASADRVAANTAVTAHFIAKLGVAALSRALAKELAADGVTVNCISPGVIDSQSAAPEELARMVKKIPAGAIGSVEDVVSAARFLLSDEAHYITGANLVVSGGWGL